MDIKSLLTEQVKESGISMMIMDIKEDIEQEELKFTSFINKYVLTDISMLDEGKVRALFTKTHEIIIKNFPLFPIDIDTPEQKDVVRRMHDIIMHKMEPLFGDSKSRKYKFDAGLYYEHPDNMGELEFQGGWISDQAHQDIDMVKSFRVIFY